MSGRGKRSWVIGFVYRLIEEEGPLCAAAIIDRMMHEKNRLNNRHVWLTAHTAVSLAMILRVSPLFVNIGRERVAATGYQQSRLQITWDIVPLETVARSWMSKIHTTKRYNQLPKIMREEIERIREAESDATTQ